MHHASRDSSKATAHLTFLRHRLRLAALVAIAALIGPASALRPQGKPELPADFATPTDGAWRFDEPRILAYEDHEHFTYVVAVVLPRDEGGLASRRLVRRLVLLEPATAVLDDFVTGSAAAADARRVHVLHGFPSDAGHAAVRSEVERGEDAFHVMVETQNRVLRLTLPRAEVGAGEIAIDDLEGVAIVPARLLPSGVLPHGPAGRRLLASWDSRYRGEARPPWDIGRPSRELVEAVEGGELRPCRAVVLGCGTGTNAVYLAEQGFDVTGIDIAPTALELAQAKADKAGVRVTWLLADVTAPPEVAPFDLVYDRGCYHGVRRGNAAGYVAALRTLTRPGAQVLILAGNANEERHYGPPRVTEEQLRGDFTADFDFVQLRETRFETHTEGETGALAWSILLRRKGEAKRD